MQIITNKKKTERTEAQKLRGFYVSMALILLMVAVCLILRPRGPKPKDPFETMNGQLDSLVDATYGPGVGLDDLSQIETVSQRDSLNLLLTSLQRELKIQQDLNRLLGRTTGEERLKEEIDRLGEELSGLEGEGRFCYSRRLRLTLPDGKKVTGFQQSDQELTRSRLVNMSEVPEGTQRLQEDIEKGLDVNTQQMDEE